MGDVVVVLKKADWLTSCSGTVQVPGARVSIGRDSYFLKFLSNITILGESEPKFSKSRGSRQDTGSEFVPLTVS